MRAGGTWSFRLDGVGDVLQENYDFSENHFANSYQTKSSGL